MGKNNKAKEHAAKMNTCRHEVAHGLYFIKRNVGICTHITTVRNEKENYTGRFEFEFDKQLLEKVATSANEIKKASEMAGTFGNEDRTINVSDDSAFGQYMYEDAVEHVVGPMAETRTDTEMIISEFDGDCDKFVRHATPDVMAAANQFVRKNKQLIEKVAEELAVVDEMDGETFVETVKKYGGVK